MLKDGMLGGDDAAKLKALVERWGECGRLVGEAISVRNYEVCNKASQEATVLFTEMKSILNFKGIKLESDLEELLLSKVAVWRRNIEAMPEWLESAKSELDSVKRRISTRRKIGDVYKTAGSPHSGVRVKLKAR